MILSSPLHHHPVSKTHYLILKYQCLLDAPAQSPDLPPRLGNETKIPVVEGSAHLPPPDSSPLGRALGSSMTGLG